MNDDLKKGLKMIVKSIMNIDKAQWMFTTGSETFKRSQFARNQLLGVLQHEGYTIDLNYNLVKYIN